MPALLLNISFFLVWFALVWMVNDLVCKLHAYVIVYAMSRLQLGFRDMRSLISMAKLLRNMIFIFGAVYGLILLFY